MTLWTPANLAVAPRMWLNGDNAVFSGSNLTSIANSGSDGSSFALGGTPTQQIRNSLNGILLTSTSQYLSILLGAWSSGKLHVYGYVKLNSRTGISTGLLRKLDVNTAKAVNFQPDGDEFGSQSLIGDQYGTGTPTPSANGYPGASLGTTNAGSVQGLLGTTVLYRLNGTDISASMSLLTGALPNDSGQTWFVGQEWGGAGTRFEGAVYQLLVFDYALTTLEMEKLEGWAHWKYGDQALLPGGHTYASAAPTTTSSFAAACAMAGLGTLTSQAKRSQKAAAAITGLGTLTSQAKRSQKAAAAITALGTVTSDARRSQKAATAMTGSGVQTAASLRRTPAAVAMTGSGVMGNAALSLKPVAVAMTGSGALSATAAGGSAGGGGSDGKGLWLERRRRRS